MNLQAIKDQHDDLREELSKRATQANVAEFCDRLATYLEEHRVLNILEYVDSADLAAEKLDEWRMQRKVIEEFSDIIIKLPKGF